jgi:hypothetical protein
VVACSSLSETISRKFREVLDSKMAMARQKLISRLELACNGVSVY